MCHRLLLIESGEQAIISSILELPQETWEMIIEELRKDCVFRSLSPLFKTCTVSKQWYDQLLASVRDIGEDVMYCFELRLYRNKTWLAILSNWSSFLSKLTNLREIKFVAQHLNGADHESVLKQEQNVLKHILFRDSSIAAFSNILSLRLSHINRIINDAIPYLTQLKTLYLFKGSITDESLRQLTNLVRLELFHCGLLTRYAFNETSHPNLKHLQIMPPRRTRHNRNVSPLAPCIINRVWKMTQLETLSITYEDYDSDDSSEEEEDEEAMTLVRLCVHKVQFMTNLVELRLDGGKMAIRDSSLFTNLTKLTDLSFRYHESVSVHDYGLSALTNLTQLSIVDQTPGGLCDITPSVLEWFPFVTSYHFQFTLSETWKALMYYFIENRSLYEGNYEKGCEEPDEYMKYVYIKRICQ
jgi:hypothetical protein